jgi:hypothetical protein
MQLFEKFLAEGRFKPGKVFLLDRPPVELTLLANQTPRDFAMAEFDTALYKVAALNG